ncbi:MAG TPA: dihydroneopterin aldolase [Thermoanaerobaculia bacterium]|nr:dihydroneopterin aldolase [Thermoanaerobaculia bacterium]
MNAPLDRLFIRDLLVRGILGVNEEERRSPQDIVIHLELALDTRPAGGSDELAHSVNYRSVCKRIIALVEGGSYLLVERLAAEIARLVLREFAVERVRVEVEKPGALRFARTVGVAIERTREDFGLDRQPQPASEG